MTATFVFDNQITIEQSSNSCGKQTKSEQDVLRKKIKKVNRLLKDLTKTGQALNDKKQKYYKKLVQKRAEYTSLLLEETTTTLSKYNKRISVLIESRI